MPSPRAGGKDVYPLVITDDDARRFLRARGVPPEWDADIVEDDGEGEGEGEREVERVPPPPLDRVAFNRLLLEAAEEAGLNVGAMMPYGYGWDGSGRDSEVEAKMLAFQERVHRVVRRPRFRGLPKARWSQWKDWGHAIGERLVTWNEYVGQLEDDYYTPWSVAWAYGRSGRSEERLLRRVREHLLRVFESLGRADRVPVAAAIHGGTVVSRCLTTEEAFYYVEDSLPAARWPAGRVRLLEQRAWSVLPEAWSLPVASAAGLVGIAAAVRGALLGHYSGGWLLPIVPALLVLTVALECGLSSAEQWCWVAPEQTFGDLARQIAQRNRREWERLQEEYGARGPGGGSHGGSDE